MTVFSKSPYVTDESRYLRAQSSQEREFEAACRRCGACCGALDDPCMNLVETNENTYACRVYDHRFGPQMTVSGKAFNCVHIREHIAAGTLREGCGYWGVKGS